MSPSPLVAHHSLQCWRIGRLSLILPDHCSGERPPQLIERLGKYLIAKLGRQGYVYLSERIDA
jgi:hypothetical protein